MSLDWSLSEPPALTEDELLLVEAEADPALMFALRRGVGTIGSSFLASDSILCDPRVEVSECHCENSTHQASVRFEKLDRGHTWLCVDSPFRLFDIHESLYVNLVEGSHPSNAFMVQTESAMRLAYRLYYIAGYGALDFFAYEVRFLVAHALSAEGLLEQVEGAMRQSACPDLTLKRSIRSRLGFVK